MSKPNLALPSSRRLLRQTWRDYRAHWKLYTLISLVVAVPTGVLGVFFDGSGVSSADAATFSAFSVVAFMFMALSFFYAATLLKRDGAHVGLRGAYYDGSAFFVKYFLVSMVLLIVAAPMLAVLGFLSQISYWQSSGQLTLTPLDQIVVDVAGFLISLPSLWLLIRYVWGLPVLIWESLWPLAAMRRGRALTLKRFWKTLWRLLVGAVVGLVLLAVIFTVAVLVAAVWPAGSSLLFNLLSNVLVLPLVIVYLLDIYRALAGDELPVVAT